VTVSFPRRAVLHSLEYLGTANCDSVCVVGSLRLVILNCFAREFYYI